MIDLSVRRQLFAEDIQVCCNLRTPALVEALATVPRERFLRPGPWLIQAEGDAGRGPRQTMDDDPRHVYHNLSIAIDPARQLFNGAPGVVTSAIDALSLQPGERVLHVGCGLGYYSALIGYAVGRSGRVVALDVDEVLAAEAAHNTAAMEQVSVRHGDASQPLGETFDAIFVNAGVTHPLDVWLDALSAEGRLVLPLTATAPQTGTIGKGMMLLIAKQDDAGTPVAPATPDALATRDDVYAARMINYIAVYSAIGLRDDSLNALLTMALRQMPFPPLKRLRRDSHDADASCWYHAPGFCFSLS
jgi:protein-L-isoaspartate(D-aspartate) O-methyltransferase